MNDFFGNLRVKFSAFMQDRYGMDNLNRALCILAVILLIVNAIVGWRIFRILAWLVLAAMVVRFLSKNPISRMKENEWWDEKSKGMKASIASVDRSWRDRKTTLYFKCDECKTQLSVPRGKGKIRVICPKCKKEMFKNT